MATARRLYLYVVSGAALTLLIAGLGSLLSLLLSKLGPPQALPSDIYYRSPDNDTISMGVSLVVVGLPLWLVHWIAIERGVRRQSGAVERRSIVRAVFFGLVLANLLAIAAYATAWAGGTALADLITPPVYGSRADLSGPVALGTVCWAFFAYFWIARSRDIGSGALERGSASLTRLYLYGTAFAAGLIALQSASQILHVAWASFAYVAGFGSEPLPFGYADAGDAAIRGFILSASMAVVWALIWAGQFRYAGTRLVTAESVASAAVDGAPIASVVRTERRSRLRQTYLAVFAFAGAIAVAAAASAAGEDLLGWVFAVPETAGGWGRGPALVDALLLSVPFAIAWWWHMRRAGVESLDVPVTSPDARRVGRYLVAIVGVTYGAVALAMLVNSVLGRVLGPGVVASTFQTDPWRAEVAAATAQAAVGLAISLLAWQATRARLLASPASAAAERDSTARRWYLYLVTGASILAAVAGLAGLIYQFMQFMLGEDVAMGSAISGPLSAVLVGGGVVLIHAIAIRADTAAAGDRLSALPAAEVAPTPAPTSAPTPAPGPAPTLRVLVISGPPDADLDALRVTLAYQIPEGFSVEIGPART